MKDKKNKKNMKNRNYSYKFICFVLLVLSLFSIVIFCSVKNYYSFKSDANFVNSNLNQKVSILGKNIGLKLYTNGALVIGMSEIETNNGEMVKPYQGSKIEIGDIIKEVNGIRINKAEDIKDILNKNGEKKIEIKFEKEKELITTNMCPVKAYDGSYMLGLWIRDSAAGLGTLTFVDKENNSFAALGHGIEDIDTGRIIDVSNGEIVTSKIISIIKAKNKEPGEIRGTIDEGIKLGNLIKNTDIGVYGSISNNEFISQNEIMEVDVANRNQIKKGKAEIYCELENGKVDKFEIEIKRIYRMNSMDNKSMLIKITDKRLLEKTGGIIPGMSGTPIIQDGKFIGAITHVLVNNPTEGYAVFADMMIKQMREVE